MIRAGEAGRAATAFLSRGCIAIGGAEPGVDFLTMTHADLVYALAFTHPGKPRSTLSNWARQDINFRDSMQIGDMVLTYRPRTRSYPAGIVTGDATFDASFLRDHRPWGMLRAVTWQETLARDALPGTVHAALDRRTTLHQIPQEAATLIAAAMKGQP